MNCSIHVLTICSYTSESHVSVSCCSQLRCSQQSWGWAVPLVQGTGKTSHWHSVVKTHYSWSKRQNSSCDHLPQRSASLDNEDALIGEKLKWPNLNSAVECYLCIKGWKWKRDKRFFQLQKSGGKRRNGRQLAMNIFRLEIRRLLTIRRKRFCDSQPKGAVGAHNLTSFRIDLGYLMKGIMKHGCLQQ